MALSSLTTNRIQTPAALVLSPFIIFFFSREVLEPSKLL